MREFKIACAGSRKAAVWRNSKTTWSALCERLRQTVYTAETPDEYRNMGKDDRDNAKDHGGFVGGYLKDGKRKIANVECRSLITHDVDEPEPGFFDRFTRGFKYAAVLYSTHSHTPDSPRYRVVIPLEEDIPPERYAAVSRYLAAEFDIGQYDPVSFVTNQLMHWPSTPKGGEYICKILDGPFLNADSFLAEHPGWEDYTKLPIADRERRQKSPGGKKQEDPLTKEGIVGAFCRTYSISEAIEKFLPDKYAPSASADRYDYIPGEGSCGVVVYDDKFAYSHHATDPAGGRLSNAFDLVRWHRFGNEDEKTSYLMMCGFAENDDLVKETLENERLAKAREDFENAVSDWEEPIPFGRYELEPFPVDALPVDIGRYVKAVAESTQTPVDMAGTASLVLMSVCTQGKYVVRGKSDWSEPMNIFGDVIASPSERKSAVLHLMAQPLDNYEVQYNIRNAARVEGSRIRKNILERKRRAVEEQILKGKAEPDDLDKIAKELSEFREEKPLHLYVDDITTEKLVSVMASSGGLAALISSEGGIFDTLAGIYTKTVNIDVFLKGYSGDTIRVDRVGRDSETVMNPCLSILLMTQPKVISDVLKNKTFRGRGLTARFLYSMPASFVGSRRFQSQPIPDAIYQRYEQKMVNMLEDEYLPRAEIITLSWDASRLLTDFAEELEPKIKGEYAEISDWAGKLVGNTLRIAGLLCRAEVIRSSEFLTENEELVVSGDTMEKAIRLARYYLSHALAVFDAVPEAAMHRQAGRILQMIREKSMTEFDRRTAMRNCRTFKTVAELQPVLDFLDDYGYLIRLPEKPFTGGRPPLPKYMVNPAVLSQDANYGTAV